MRVSLRPDPRKGVFETMLVLAGEPVELDAHLERLAASLHALYRAKPPADAAAAALARARPLEHGRLRLTVTPTAAGLSAEIATAKIEPAAVFPTAERCVALRSVAVEHGLGEHKWADRRLLEEAAAALAPGELPLLVDADGLALEASRGSVFAVGPNGLRTPPTDGRILPGIARRGAIEVSLGAGIAAEETPLAIDELAQGEAFLAGSVRGIEPVASIDGVALPRPGKLSLGIAAGLRRRWHSARATEPVAAGAGGRPAGRPAH